MYSAVRLGHFTELTRGLTATAVCKVDLSHWKATKEERAFASPSFTNRGEIFSERASLSSSTCAFYKIYIYIYQGPHRDHYKTGFWDCLKIKRNFPNSTYNRMSTLLLDLPSESVGENLAHFI